MNAHTLTYTTRTMTISFKDTLLALAKKHDDVVYGLIEHVDDVDDDIDKERLLRRFDHKYCMGCELMMERDTLFGDMKHEVYVAIVATFKNSSHAKKHTPPQYMIDAHDNDAESYDSHMYKEPSYTHVRYTYAMNHSDYITLDAQRALTVLHNTLRIYDKAYEMYQRRCAYEIYKKYQPITLQKGTIYVYRMKNKHQYDFTVMKSDDYMPLHQCEVSSIANGEVLMDSILTVTKLVADEEGIYYMPSDDAAIDMLDRIADLINTCYDEKYTNKLIDEVRDILTA